MEMLKNIENSIEKKGLNISFEEFVRIKETETASLPKEESYPRMKKINEKLS